MLTDSKRIGAGWIGLLIAALVIALIPAAADASPRVNKRCVPASGSERTAAVQSPQSGGVSISPRQHKASTEGTTPAAECQRPGRARLTRDGRAIPPANAPARVRKVIRWGNHIRKKPYIYGGGHARFFDRGYDCSGAISFALRGGGFVSSPMPSTGYMGWGRPGKGRWITVYAHGGHAYMVVAGLRLDTSGTGGNGPRWQRDDRSPSGFAVRHHPRF